MAQVRTTIAALFAVLVVAAPAQAAAPSVQITGPTAASTYYTAAATVALDGVASDDGTVTTVDWFNAANASNGVAAGTTTWTIASIPLAAGTNIVTVTATDDAAETGDDTITVIRDNTNPTVSVTRDVPVSSPTNSGAAQISYSAADDSGTVSVDCSLVRDGITTVFSGSGVACPSPKSFVGLTAGSYEYSVTATDPAGNADSDSVLWTVDTTAPTFTTQPTLTTEHTTGFTNDPTAELSWATDDPGATYVCYVDAISQGPCTSSFTTAALSAGSHNFQVVATDTAGNVTNSSLKSFTVDTTSPTFSFGALSTHGASNWATDVTSVSMSVTPSETLDGGGAFCDIGTGCVPTVSFAGLAAGEHTLNASGTDRAGNAGSSPRSFFVDLADPDAPSIGTNPPVDTNDNTPTFGFSGTDPAPSSAGGSYGNLTYQCRLAPVEGSFTSCSSTKTYTAKPDGNYTFHVRATDPSGRTGVAQSYAFEIDTVPPVISNFDIAPNGHTVNYTNTTTPTITFDSSESATFECRLDGGAWGACTDDGPGTSGSHTPTAAEGHPHTLNVRGTDPATNVTSPVASYVFGVDTTLPDPEATVPDGSAYELHDNPAITCSDPLGGGWASGVYTCVANIVGYGPQFNIPTHSDDFGYHEFTVTATDEAGNSDTTGAAHYVVNSGTYLDAVDDLNPLGHWRLNNSQGAGTMSDASGNGNTGLYRNGVGLPRSGPHVDLATNTGAGAAEFGGKAYGYVNDINAPQTAYTMDAWIKPASTEAMSILSHGAGAGEIFVNADGRLAFRHADTTIVDNTTALTPGHWFHVQATWSRPLAHQPGTLTLRAQRIDGSPVTTTGSSSKNASGRSTFYVGFGEQAGAQAFKGLMAEAAYFGTALGAHAFADLTETMKWTFTDVRPGANFARPSVAIAHPLDGDGFQTSKAPASGTIDFSCADPLDDGNEGVSCTAKLNGNPVSYGDPLPALAGSHTLTVTADDGAGDPVSKSVTFVIGTFSAVYNQDSPVAYWRLDENTNSTTLIDLAGNHHGIYKWDPSDPLALVNGGPGISGDLNTTQQWLGRGAYAYVNGLSAPADASSVEAWVKLDNPARDQMILQHGGGSTLYVQGGQFVYRPNGNMDVKAVGGTATTGFQQVVGTWDGITARLYVDGNPVDAIAAPTPPPSGASTFYLGRGDIGLPGLHGILDEVAYFNKQLSARRVMLHFLADPPPPAGATPTGTRKPAAVAVADSRNPSAAAKPTKAVAKAKKALAKAKAKLKALKKRHASKKAVARAKKAVKVAQKRLARARRA